MVKKFMKKYLKNQRGLTLIELLAVIVILGIIAAIAIPSIGGIIENSKTKAHKANALMLLDAAKLYYMDHPGDNNKTFSDTPATGELDIDVLVEKGYLEAVPKDPAGSGEYAKIKIQYNTTKNALVVTLGTSDDEDKYLAAKSRSELTE